MQQGELIAFSRPIGSLGQYVQFVERFPVLTEQQEKQLSFRLRRNGDLDAAWQLVSSHLRLVVRIARGYRGYGLPQEDLIQEGNIGLMRAVKRFDPSRDVRLAVYAAYWIRAQIHDFILRNWRIVRVATTRAKRKLFYKLKSAKHRLGWLKKEETEEIAGALNVSAKDVSDMEGKLYGTDVSFDPLFEADDDDSLAPAKFVGDSRFDPDSLVSEAEFVEKASDQLAVGLSLLDERSRDIVKSRWLVEEDQKLTLAELAKRYGVSIERARQIEAAAIKRLRAHLVSRLGVDRCAVGVPRSEALPA